MTEDDAGSYRSAFNDWKENKDALSYAIGTPSDKEVSEALKGMMETITDKDDLLKHELKGSKYVKKEGHYSHLYKPIEGDPFGILDEPPVDMKELVKDL